MVGVAGREARGLGCAVPLAGPAVGERVESRSLHDDALEPELAAGAIRRGVGQSGVGGGCGGFGGVLAIRFGTLAIVFLLAMESIPEGRGELRAPR